MRKITKIEIESLMKCLDYSKDEYIGFTIVDNDIRLLHSNTSKGIYYRIDGFIERWKNNKDTLNEMLGKIQDYINDVIELYNEGSVNHE